MSEKTFSIKFVAIEMISKSIVAPPFEISGPETFNFNFLVDLQVQATTQTALVVSDVAIVWVKQNIEVAKFKILCAFQIGDFDNVFKKVEEKKYDAEPDLEIILKSAGLSTIRGVIASEVKGTYLQGAVLPLIDMAALIKSQKKENAKVIENPSST